MKKSLQKFGKKVWNGQVLTSLANYSAEAFPKNSSKFKVKSLNCLLGFISLPRHLQTKAQKRRQRLSDTNQTLSFQPNYITKNYEQITWKTHFG
jgi:hypothetical protein